MLKKDLAKVQVHLLYLFSPMFKITIFSSSNFTISYPHTLKKFNNTFKALATYLFYFLHYVEVFQFNPLKLYHIYFVSFKVNFFKNICTNGYILCSALYKDLVNKLLV